MRNLVIASHNEDKIKEFKQILTPLGVDIVNPLFPPIPDVEESGTTFAENAALKAKSAFQHTQTPSFGDDSGICVDALDGKPGIYTARYAKERGLPLSSCLLQDLQHVSNLQERTATAVCALALVDKDGETHIFESRVKGVILTETRGERGFGFDFIFAPFAEIQQNFSSPSFPRETDILLKTYAEMSAEEKNQKSHRRLAINKMLQFIKQQPSI